MKTTTVIGPTIAAPVAQLDRVSGYEPEGREFESLRARHKQKGPPREGLSVYRVLLEALF